MDHDLDLDARIAAQAPPYRSRGEAQVGRLLDRYGIPFLHEYPTVIYDRGRHHLWHPDFTLPTYASMIVEYAGMPDRPEYMKGIHHKRRVYRNNRLPAIFIYPRHLTSPSWPQRLYELISYAGQRALAGYRQQSVGYQRSTSYLRP
ncbi:MAG TPA: hypothetical protein P5159_26700 [Phycisphaerae bacterium]|nr:hypothetical protein [Phycisphaerae bacterium]